MAESGIQGSLAPGAVDCVEQKNGLSAFVGCLKVKKKKNRG